MTGRVQNLKPWKPGQSGNPGGRRKDDVAAEIARAVFEGNKQAIYNAMLNGLLRGNASVFKELAERGYGKLTARTEVAFKDTSDASLDERIAELERDLGLTAQIDEAPEPKLPTAPEDSAPEQG